MSSPAAISRESDHPEVATQCASCNSSLSGPYCSACGEHVVERDELTMRHFLSHGLVHEFTHLDSKIVRTFRLLLFRPGFLSQEYFAGRRRLYVNPVRLLLTAALIFALAVHGSYMSLTIGPLQLNLLPPRPPSEASIEETIKKVDVLGAVSHIAQWKARTKDITSQTAAEKFNHEFRTYGTALSFCNVGLLALFLFVIYRHRRPLFLEHLVFSFHLASFVLLFSIAPGWLFRLLTLASNQQRLSIAVVAGALFVLITESVYLYYALLRFYRSDLIDKLRWWSGSAWFLRGAVVLVFLVNSVFITLTYAAGAAIAVLRI